MKKNNLKQPENPSGLSRSAQYMTRSNIYHFLSLIYLREPTLEFVELLKARDFRDTLTALGVTFDDIFDTLDSFQLQQILQSEYTAIFIGPDMHVPPYESVFTEKKIFTSGYGQMCGRAAAEVEDYYRKYDYQVSDEFKNIPDQVGVELSFMSLLCAQQDAGRNLSLDQTEFIENHLANWLPHFCKQAAALANLNFYKSVIGLTNDFIISEKASLQIRPKTPKTGQIGERGRVSSSL